MTCTKPHYIWYLIMSNLQKQKKQWFLPHLIVLLILSHRCSGLLQDIFLLCYQLDQLLLTSLELWSALGLFLSLPSKRADYYHPISPPGSSNCFLPHAITQIHFFSSQRPALSSSGSHFPCISNQVPSSYSTGLPISSGISLPYVAKQDLIHLNS